MLLIIDQMNTTKKPFICFVICGILILLCYQFDVVTQCIDYWVYRDIDNHNDYIYALHNVDNNTTTYSVGMKQFLSDMANMRIYHNHYLEIMPIAYLPTYLYKCTNSSENTMRIFKFAIVGSETHVNNDEYHAMPIVYVFKLKNVKNSQEINWKMIFDILILSNIDFFPSEDMILQIKVMYFDYYVIVENKYMSFEK